MVPHKNGSPRKLTCVLAEWTPPPGRPTRLASAELMDAVGVAVRNASKHLAPVLSALIG